MDYEHNCFAYFFSPSFCLSAETVSFKVTPATDEEKAVAKTLENMISAYNEKNIDKHVNCYAADAKIGSKLTGGSLSKEEYRETLKKRKKLPKLKLKDAKILKLSPTKYQVDAILSSNRMFYILFDLISLEGRWVVLEQR